MPTPTVADLVVPAGPIDPEIVWPGTDEDLRMRRLTGYLEAGVRQAAGFTNEALRFRAAVWWAVYRIRDALYQSMARMPAQLSKQGEGSQGTLVPQIQMMREERDAALGEYQTLELEDAGEEEEVETFTTLRSLRD